MNPLVGDDERALADAVATWARSVEARIEPAEAAGTLPADVIREVAKLGVLGMTVPEADGGLGASARAFALVLEELACAWPSLAVGVSVNSGIVSGSVVRYGTAAQRAHWLPRLADGGGLGAFALTEASSGSDAASLRASAVRDGASWLLRGTKLFVTNARYAPVIVLLARVGEPEPAKPHAGITAFLVPGDARGLVIGPAERKMGLHASDTAAVTLEEVRVDDEAVLGEVGRGFGIALAGLDSGRIGIAAQAIGIARGAIERAAAYAKERQQFGAPLASFQALRVGLAAAHSELDAARLLALRAAWRKDSGLPFTVAASQAKLYASEAAQRATHLAVQLHGGYGYVRDYAVERHARDARATTIYEGTSEIQRIVIARSLVAAL